MVLVPLSWIKHSVQHKDKFSRYISRVFLAILIFYTVGTLMLMIYVCISCNEKCGHTLTCHKYEKKKKNLKQFSEDFALFQNDHNLSQLSCPTLP